MSSVAVAHAVPGRVRLRLAPLKGDEAAAAALAAGLRAVSGVHAVEASARTGSVLLHYDAALLTDPAALAALTAAVRDVLPEVAVEDLAALADLDMAQGPAGPWPEAEGAEVRRLDWRLAVPAGLALLGVAAFLRTRRRAMPDWHTLLWYAFGTFTTLAGRGRS